MTKFVGIKNNNIYVISDTEFTSIELQTIKLPKELENTSFEELVLKYKFKENKLVNIKGNKKANEMKIAFVGNYNMQCGISTYNENLWPEISKYFNDFKLLIEKNDTNTLSNKFGENKIIECWKRGENLQELVNEIKNYDPDIILLGHEFGLFPNCRHWLSFLTQVSDYRVIITMHSVFPDHYDKTIYEAAMKEIVVHLDKAKESLENNKKIKAKITVIPHGCYPIIDQNKMWDNYKSQHTVVQQGFGFKYKNFETSIRTTALLKTKYPDIFFTALISESPFNKLAHQQYYNELKDLVYNLNLNDNVALVRGFQSDEVINSYLRSNQVALFPYLTVPGHICLGSSGAVRISMAAGLPVITSNIPHFSDIPSIKINNAEEIAQEIDKLFSNNSLIKEQIKKQNQFIENNSWEIVAQKYIEIIENAE